jgi:hypothetical protein
MTSESFDSAVSQTLLSLNRQRFDVTTDFDTATSTAKQTDEELDGNIRVYKSTVYVLRIEMSRRIRSLRRKCPWIYTRGF